MNIVKISDGLGNQMFQYAFARKLQIDTGKTVYLDTRYVNNEDAVFRGENNYYTAQNDFRKYGLNHFKIRLNIADENALRNWSYLYNAGILQREIYTMAQKGLWPWGYCDEDLSGINIKKHLSMYYKGYFFDLKYYDSIKKVLVKEFVLKNKLHLPAELRDILKNDATVSVHVRRGDFVKLNRDISQKGYYPRALRLMEEKVENPTYLIFSDDVEWVKNNLKIGGKTVYVSSMGFMDYQEMMIMKHCQHYIIANSTFSYWAAYLNQNPDKIVICPKHWKTAIIPEEWISI